MKYLIIKTDDWRILSEEESLVKFKEIWMDGNDSGFCDGFDGYSTQKTKDQDWNEFKEKL
jgi:hypothetical protein